MLLMKLHGPSPRRIRNLCTSPWPRFNVNREKNWTRSTAWMPTTVRPGNSSAKLFHPRPSKRLESGPAVHSRRTPAAPPPGIRLHETGASRRRSAAQDNTFKCTDIFLPFAPFRRHWTTGATPIETHRRSQPSPRPGEERPAWRIVASNRRRPDSLIGQVVQIATSSDA
jgi:hypothetical protein